MRDGKLITEEFQLLGRETHGDITFRDSSAWIDPSDVGKHSHITAMPKWVVSPKTARMLGIPLNEAEVTDKAKKRKKAKKIRRCEAVEKFMGRCIYDAEEEVYQTTDAEGTLYRMRIRLCKHHADELSVQLIFED